MSPIERYDPDTGMLTYRKSHALTPWVSASFMVAFGALAYTYGGVGGGGRGTAPTPTQVVYSAPTAPTLEAVVVLAGDTAAYAQASAFAGDYDDSLEYTVFEWDTVTGSFTLKVDTVATPVLRDTVLTNPGTFKAGGIYKVRALQRGYEGGNSAYSVVDTFTASAVTVYFCSDWGTTTGKTSTALADASNACGTAWPTVDVGLDSSLAVVNATSAGLTNWPTTNALEWTAYDPDGFTAWAELDSANSPVPTPANGDTIVYRFYVALTPQFNDPNQMHPVQNTRTFGDREFLIRFGRGSATTYWTEWSPDNNNHNPFPNDFWTASAAANTNPDVFYFDSTYRFEWLFAFNSDTTYTMDVRIYNGVDSLLWGGATIYNQNASQNLGSSPTLNVKNGLYRFKGLVIGSNGLESGSDNLPWLYYGGLAICSNWCGPYAGGK